MQKIYLEPLNKDEMILIGDSPSRNDHGRGGWGTPPRVRREDTSFIINTVRKKSKFFIREIKYLSRKQ